MLRFSLNTLNINLIYLHAVSPSVNGSCTSMDDDVTLTLQLRTASLATVTRWFSVSASSPPVQISSAYRVTSCLTARHCRVDASLWHNPEVLFLFLSNFNLERVTPHSIMSALINDKSLRSCTQLCKLRRGGFRHVQHVQPNRRSHKKGPYRPENVEQQRDVFWPPVGASLWRRCEVLLNLT